MKLNILGYFEDDFHNPIAFMNSFGLIVFSNNIKLKLEKKLGGISELHNILSDINYYKINREFKMQKGSGGFFGESSGKCGWGDSPSCCFFGCEPLWKTNLWPFDITM
jgi:hypothetical protein